MKETALKLFTDGSVHTRSGIGYGAYLWVDNLRADRADNLCIDNYDISSIDTLKHNIQLKRFCDTRSSRLELQTLLWALNEWFENNNGEHTLIECYTDSQTIVGLPERRAKLEANNFCSKKGLPLSNADLYKQFYALMDNLCHINTLCKLVKLAGHQPQKNKTPLDHFFTLVDKAARNAVRNIA